MLKLIAKRIKFADTAIISNPDQILSIGEHGSCIIGAGRTGIVLILDGAIDGIASHMVAIQTAAPCAYPKISPLIRCKATDPSLSLVLALIIIHHKTPTT